MVPKRFTARPQGSKIWSSVASSPSRPVVSSWMRAMSEWTSMVVASGFRRVFQSFAVPWLPATVVSQAEQKGTSVMAGGGAGVGDGRANRAEVPHRDEVIGEGQKVADLELELEEASQCSRGPGRDVFDLDRGVAEHSDRVHLVGDEDFRREIHRGKPQGLPTGDGELGAKDERGSIDHVARPLPTSRSWRSRAGRMHRGQPAPRG